MFRVNNRKTRKKREICSKLIIKKLGCRSGVFVVNFDFILLLFQVYIVEFEQAYVCWVIILK